MPFGVTSLPSDSSSPVRRSHGLSTGRGVHCKRVLVVEDNFLLSEMLCVEISASGMVPVGPASRLDEALELANEARIDAALVDVNLGEVSLPNILSRDSRPWETAKLPTA